MEKGKCWHEHPDHDRWPQIPKKVSMIPVEGNAFVFDVKFCPVCGKEIPQAKGDGQKMAAEAIQYMTKEYKGGIK